MLLPSRFTSVVTTDSVMENVHFTRATFSMEDIGAKAIAVNVSDIAAMGARPRWMTCALGLPRWVTDAQLTRLATGAAHVARRFGVELIGGNVTRADALSVTVTMSGEVEGRPLLRSGARPGDLLFVSGPLGSAAAGLRAFERPARERARWSRVMRAQRRPAPHVAFGLAVAPWCSAAIDVSDGLLQDLGHVCDASRVGAQVESSAIPIAEDVLAVAGKGALELALRGGEDYVLLVAVRPRNCQSFDRALRKAGLEAFPIGELTVDRALRVDGQRVTGGRLGFQHF